MLEGPAITQSQQESRPFPSSAQLFLSLQDSADPWSLNVTFLSELALILMLPRQLCNWQQRECVMTGEGTAAAGLENWQTAGGAVWMKPVVYEGSEVPQTAVQCILSGDIVCCRRWTGQIQDTRLPAVVHDTLKGLGLTFLSSNVSAI